MDSLTSSSIAQNVLNPNAVWVIGAGAAGLMAAQQLADAGIFVQILDAMPNAGRKFLVAGKGGLNLTHSEEFALFIKRYAKREAVLSPLLAEFGAEQIKEWTHSLGIETFVGSSGRVFPKDMKASPLLRAWLQRLHKQGVQLLVRHRWLGFASDENENQKNLKNVDGLNHNNPNNQLKCRIQNQSGEIQTMQPRALILALGGASWARSGSDGAWVSSLKERGIQIAPLSPANCGFDVNWSPYFSQHFAGHPMKSVALRFTDSLGATFDRRGEFVITQTGVEGSLIYAISALLRDEIERHQKATFTLDLLPDFTLDRVLSEIKHPRGSRSLANHLKSRLNFDGVKLSLLHEHLGRAVLADHAALPLLAQTIKALPITVCAARPIDEAISTSGGVLFEELNNDLMFKKLSGVFCAGEMLDWEAPTGGYLLTASFSTGRRAGLGAVRWLKSC